MIQAVAEDEERGALGMHYTSVPNILMLLQRRFYTTKTEADKMNEKQNIRSMLLSFLCTHKNDNADVARPWKTGPLA